LAPAKILAAVEIRPEGLVRANSRVCGIAGSLCLAYPRTFCARSAAKRLN